MLHLHPLGLFLASWHGLRVWSCSPDIAITNEALCFVVSGPVSLMYRPPEAAEPKESAAELCDPASDTKPLGHDTILGHYAAGHLRQQTPDVAEHLLLRAAGRKILAPPLASLLGSKFEPLLHEVFNFSGMQVRVAHSLAPAVCYCWAADDTSPWVSVRCAC